MVMGSKNNRVSPPSNTEENVTKEMNLVSEKTTISEKNLQQTSSTPQNENSTKNEVKPLVSSNASRWYRWNRINEEKPREISEKPREISLKTEATSGKINWYKDSKPIETVEPLKVPSSVTEEKENSDSVRAAPSYILRSTAVYIPPHGDRFLPGRDLGDEINKVPMKFYRPENQSFDHSRTTMFKMDTRTRQISQNDGSSSISSPIVHRRAAAETTEVRTFASLGIQTDLQTDFVNDQSGQIRYFEKEKVQTIPVAPFSEKLTESNGFYYFGSSTKDQPVLPDIEKTPVWSEETTMPKSILKNGNGTNVQLSEEVRKQNPDLKDATFRVKKVHLIEKEKSSVSAPISSSEKKSKASQSISKSEQIFLYALFHRKI